MLITKLLFQNLSVRQTIYKNTFWLSFSAGINKLLALALIIYAARILGAEGYGQFTFALAFVSLLVVFSDFGLAGIITREFAREKEKKEDFYSLISLKLVLAVGTFLLIALLSFFVTPAREMQMLIIALGLFLLMNSLTGIFHSFFHAREKMEYEAWFEILQTVLIVVFGLFILLHFPSPVNLSYVYFFSALLVSIPVFLFFHIRIFSLKVRWDFLVWKKFLKMSWPLALMGLFGVVYSYTDSVMLGSWNMLEETGWYNAAQKIVLAGLVPMGLIGASFYPALSKFSKGSKEKFQKVWDTELEIMIVLALPLVVGGMILASKIMNSFYPADFAPSILAFKILIGTAGLIFLYRPFYDAMVVLNQQGKIFWVTMTGAVFNVALNFILIPKYSLYGAAIATVCTYILVLFIVVLFVKKFTYIQLPFIRIFLTFVMSGLAVILMYAVLKQLILYNIHIFFLVLAGAATYFLGVFVLRKYIALKYFKQIYV